MMGAVERVGEKLSALGLMVCCEYLQQCPSHC